MTSVTVSRSSTFDSSTSHKKRSSKASAGLNAYKASAFFGQWKHRSTRSPRRVNSQEEREAHELLKTFVTKKDFSLPSSLPPWSPPPQGLGEISPELRLYRDYSRVRQPTSTRKVLGTAKAFQDSHGSERVPIDEDSRTSVTITGSKHAKASVDSPRRKDAAPHPPPSDRLPPPPPRVPTTTSSQPSNAPSNRSPPSEKDLLRKEIPPSRATDVEAKKPAASASTKAADLPSGAVGTDKGQAKLSDTVLDWSDWRPQRYAPKTLGELRAKYADRGKDLKRLAESEMREVHHLRDQSEDPQKAWSAAEGKTRKAVVMMVDSLLLFTQSFLCMDLEPPQTNGHQTQQENFNHWHSVLGFLHATKGSAKRTGIDVLYGICLMYEGLLLQKISDAERPLLLQRYDHDVDPDRQQEGFRKFKNLLARQEAARYSWRTAQVLFQRLFDSPGASSPSPSNHRHDGLPKLATLTRAMRPRAPNGSPQVMSVDGPWRFCWPIDQTDRYGMADFVAFGRAALEEWIEGSGTEYKLEGFSDLAGLFSTSR